MIPRTRAFLDDIDGDVLTQVHSGEENVLDANSDALAANLPGPVREQLVRMLAELSELLDDTRPIT